MEKRSVRKLQNLNFIHSSEIVYKKSGKYTVENIIMQYNISNTKLQLVGDNIDLKADDIPLI